MEVGQIFNLPIVVAEKDSAKVLGSGGLDVFGTPALVAYMESAALKMVQNDLPDGSDTVGIAIDVKHVKASPIGAKINVSAKITAVEGRKISFDIVATDEAGDVVGSAVHDRFVVDKARFMSKL
ncbi:MAG: thioesterase family protein [Paludibacteraceae bacterium]|nr:thioesterase family protein [Paludibacteraceae bacterium]